MYTWTLTHAHCVLGIPEAQHYHIMSVSHVHVPGTCVAGLVWKTFVLVSELFVDCLTKLVQP